jgi:hypothetical protein
LSHGGLVVCTLNKYWSYASAACNCQSNVTTLEFGRKGGSLLTIEQKDHDKRRRRDDRTNRTEQHRTTQNRAEQGGRKGSTNTNKHRKNANTNTDRQGEGGTGNRGGRGTDGKEQARPSE